MADTLGRVMLVDVAAVAVVRMFKGYRDAQCGWLLLPPPPPPPAVGSVSAAGGADPAGAGAADYASLGARSLR